MTLLGQEAQAAAFEAAVASGRLHHGWLLIGPKGVGKGQFARRVAAALVGGPNPDALIAARSHPDFHVVEREAWDKSTPPRIVPYDQRKEGEPLARSIRVAQVRALERILTMPPALGPRRAIVIDAADDLEREGANALLKMLEEPPQGTIFFLVSHVPGRLLPTIRSRCRALRFAPLPDAQVAALLVDAMPDITTAEAATLAVAARGSPGRALQLARHGLGGLDAVLHAIADCGDADNALRSALAKQVAGKANVERYDLLLDRVPALILERGRRLHGDALARAIAAWEQARDLASVARAQSMVPETVMFQLAGRLATLAGGDASAKA